MFIDSHMHLIQAKNFDKPTYDKLKMKIPHDTDLDTLVGWYREAGIEKCVCMGQDMSRIWNANFGEDYVMEAYKRHPEFFIPFISVEAMDKANRFNQEAYEYVKRSVEEGVARGVLMVPPISQYYSNDKTVYPFYELIQKNGLVMQYHHSAQMGPAVLSPVKYAHMEKLFDVCVDFPDMTIIVEHLGYPFTEELLEMMTNHPKMYVDLAMTYHRPQWLARNLMLAREYGVLDRVLFGTDYVCYNYDVFHENPVEDLTRWTTLMTKGLNEINEKCGYPILTQEEIDNIMCKTAAKLYNVDVK